MCIRDRAAQPGAPLRLEPSLVLSLKHGSGHLDVETLLALRFSLDEFSIPFRLLFDCFATCFEKAHDLPPVLSDSTIAGCAGRMRLALPMRQVLQRGCHHVPR